MKAKWKFDNFSVTIFLSEWWFHCGWIEIGSIQILLSQAFYTYETQIFLSFFIFVFYKQDKNYKKTLFKLWSVQKKLREENDVSIMR